MPHEDVLVKVSAGEPPPGDGGVDGLRIEFGPQGAGGDPGRPRDGEGFAFGETVEVRHVPPGLDEEVPGKAPRPMTDDDQIIGPDHGTHERPGTAVLGTDRAGHDLRLTGGAGRPRRPTT